MASITNIKGQKPDRYIEVNNLDQALANTIARKDKNKRVLIESIKDIVELFKNNYNQETDDRNVKAVDLILLRNERLLKSLLNNESSIENIILALDIDAEGCISDFYVISKDSKQLKTIKENIVLNILKALEKYSIMFQEIYGLTLNNNSLTSVLEDLNENLVENINLTLKTYVKDENYNIDNFNVILKYLRNVLSFMKGLYAEKLGKTKNIVLKKTKNLIKANLIPLKKGKILSRFNGPDKVNEKLGKLLAKKIKVQLKKAFKDNLNLNKLGIANIWNKNILKISKTSFANVLNTVKRVTKTIKGSAGKLIGKARALITKIATNIVGFVMSLVPYLGIVLKILKPIVKVFIITLKIAFKILKFAITFITSTVKFLFTGLVKSMKALTVGLVKSVKGMLGGIKKILSSPILAKVFKFLFTTPFGMYILGYITGIAYKKLILPFKLKFDEWSKNGQSDKDAESISRSLINFKNKAGEKYELLKNKLEDPNSIYRKVINFFKGFNFNEIKALYLESVIRFNRDYIKPLKHFAKGLAIFFIDKVILKGASALVSLMLTALSKIPPWGTVIAGIIGIGAGLWELFFGGDDVRLKREEMSERKRELLKLYGAGSLKKTAKHDNLLKLLTEASQDKIGNYDELFKADIQRKIEANRKIGVVSFELLEFAENLKSLIDDEIKSCRKYSNHSVEALHGDLSIEMTRDVYTTKIPIPGEIDPKTGLAKTFDTIFDVPSDVNPIGFRMLRAKMIDEALDRYNSGIISFNELINTINSMLVKTGDNLFAFNSEFLEKAKENTKLDVDRILHWTPEKIYNSDNDDLNPAQFSDSLYDLEDSMIEAMANELESDDVARNRLKEVDDKKNLVTLIIDLLIKSGILNSFSRDNRLTMIDNLYQILMRENLTEFNKKSDTEKSKYLIDILTDLSLDEDKLLEENDDRVMKKQLEEENKKNELTIAQLRSELTEAQKVAESDAQYQNAVNAELEKQQAAALDAEAAEEALTEKEFDIVKAEMDVEINRFKNNIIRLTTPGEKPPVVGTLGDIGNDALVEANRSSPSLAVAR